MNSRNFFNPRNFHPPPRSFHPSNPQFQNMISNMNMTRFNMNENPRSRQIQQNFQPPRADNNPQMQMQMQMQQQMPVVQRKRPMNPPDPPKFSDLTRDEQPQSSPKINPAYKSAVDEELKKLEDKFKEHLSDPESHPFYEKEWQLFWNRKADELTKRGEDPSDYDFHDEWCEFFIDRIRELHDEETKWKVDQIKRKYGITSCDYPPPKKARAGSRDRIETVESKKEQYDSDEDDYRHYQEDTRAPAVDDHRNFQASNAPRQFQQQEDPIPPWKMQDPNDLLSKKRKQSRFDQPGHSEEFVDHPKFRQSNFEQFGQPSSHQAQNFNFQNKNQGIRPMNPQMRNDRFQNPKGNFMRQDGPSRFMPDPHLMQKRVKKGIDKIITHTLPTIQLENVPLTMRIPDILDFFTNKLRGIVGCFRATDYIAKITSKIVYLILMDEKEIEMMENLREIYMDGTYVRISSVKLMNGSSVMDTNLPEVPGAPQSLFLTNLEKRMTETTFYIRELAKLFEPNFTITGIRICHNAKMKKSRNFGFANFINKASVDEFDGRAFKMFEYEVRCSRTVKIPLLIHVDHADVLENDPVMWSNQIRGINLLNVDM